MEEVLSTLQDWNVSRPFVETRFAKVVDGDRG